MGEPKLTPLNEESPQKGKSLKEKVSNTLTEELVFGICAPIGTIKKEFLDYLTARLKEYKYTPIIIKISDFIVQYGEKLPLSEKGKTKGYTALLNKIKGGNSLREKYGNSVLADLAIHKIIEDRTKDSNPKNSTTNVENFSSRRKFYIIDSFKNLEELEVFRDVYRDIFYCFSIFSSEQERVQNLMDSKKISEDEATTIINTDQFENNSFGQNVRGTFVEGDFFVRTSSGAPERLKDQVARYLHLIFNSKVITPNPNEQAMYQAKSAAGNSACLSRQVGASIIDKAGNLISVGWNDVPKFGGNLYQEIDPNDKRCFHLKYCSNDQKKNELVTNIIDQIKEDSNLDDSVKNDQNLKVLENIIKNSKIKSLIEYSRSVHAEMHAIISGSQLSGNRMISGKLFCTTYPCHNCARHILAAGISEVYYIEPYTKSLCIDLHSDSITENEEESEKLKLLLFDGVAPRRYLDFFSMLNDARKTKEGKIVEQDLSTFFPKKRLSLQALPALEAQATHSLVEVGLLSQ